MTAGPIPADAIAAAVAAAREQLRIADGTGEDALLARLAETAIVLGEAFTGVAFLRREGEEIVPADGDWHCLDATPVEAIDDVAGVPHVTLPIDAHAIDITADGDGWVRVAHPGVARATVAYRGGLAPTWQALPAPIRQGVAMLIAHLHDDRDAGGAPPAAVAALWQPWRRMRLTRRRA